MNTGRRNIILIPEFDPGCRRAPDNQETKQGEICLATKEFERGGYRLFSLLVQFLGWCVRGGSTLFLRRNINIHLTEILNLY